MNGGVSKDSKILTQMNANQRGYKLIPAGPLLAWVRPSGRGGTLFALISAYLRAFAFHVLFAGVRANSGVEARTRSGDAGRGGAGAAPSPSPAPAKSGVAARLDPRVKCPSKPWSALRGPSPRRAGEVNRGGIS